MAGVRRTWDKEHYEKKAKERLEKGDDEPEISSSKPKSKSLKEEFLPAPENAEGPVGSERAFLVSRKGKIDLDSKVGKTQVIAPENISAAGWFCDVCSCLLKDSVSYLDHINGKKHQRALGYSMRVERAGVDAVKDRLNTLKRKIEESKTKTKVDAVEDYESRIAEQIVEEENRKRLKKQELAARKAEQEAVEMEHVDDEIAAILGFGGFGGSKKS